MKFKKALKVLASHEKTEYHKDVYAGMVAFRDYMSKKCESIAVQLNSLHAAQIKRNREVFKSI